MVLTYCKLFNNLLQKLNKNLKKLHFGNSKKNFYVNVKTIFWSSFAFRNKFYVWTQNVIFKKV